jgi:hypothetical protein
VLFTPTSSAAPFMREESGTWIATRGCLGLAKPTTHGTVFRAGHMGAPACRVLQTGRSGSLGAGVAVDAVSVGAVLLPHTAQARVASGRTQMAPSATRFRPSPFGAGLPTLQRVLSRDVAVRPRDRRLSRPAALPPDLAVGE